MNCSNLRRLTAGGLRLFEGFIAANQSRVDNQLDARDRVAGRSAHAQVLRFSQSEMCLWGIHACNEHVLCVVSIHDNEL